MGFGQQSSIPATAKQTQYLLALVQKAGHEGFRDARGPLGLTQRQASGKFSRTEASTLIDQLLNESGDGPAQSGEEISAADRLELERVDVLRGMPAGLLAAELERRGWSVSAPA
jgi:hypothetical protein